MSMLSAAELTAMRTLAQRTLADVATVQRKTTVSDGMGGYTDTWTTVLTTTCRVAANNNLQADRSITAAQLREGVAWKVTLPFGSDVRLDDRIVVGARTFEVLGIYAPGTYETARQCACVER